MSLLRATADEASDGVHDGGIEEEELQASDKGIKYRSRVVLVMVDVVRVFRDGRRKRRCEKIRINIGGDVVVGVERRSIVPSASASASA